MKDWFMGLEARERQLVGGGAAVLLLLLLYVMIWEPLASEYRSLRDSVAQQKQNLVWMQQAAVQIKALQDVRGARDQAQVDRCLGVLRADARAGRNVMGALVAAVNAYASVGEMTGVLVEVYGRYDEPIRF